ncbi:MAG: hypothetical protein AB7F19_05110 [Candidatus Babeliales bacterium]
MKKFIYLGVLCLFASQVYGTGSRHLMLMMNWMDETLNDGQQFGALSQVTISALEQQAGPVIITSQTWRSIMGRGTDRKYPDSDVSYGVFYGSNPSFRFNDWIIKKLSDYLYLFVPKSYLNAVKAKKDSFNQDLNTVTALTQVDRELGMKVSKFPDMSQKDLFNVGYHKAYIEVKNYNNMMRKNAHTTMQQLISSGNEHIAEIYFFSQHVLYMLGKLLITRADLISKIDPRKNIAQFKEDTEKNEALLLHEWLVYLDGHGSPSDTGQIQPIIINRPGYYPGPSNIGITAGLEHNSFQQLLKFFNGSVVTGGMLYASCFAGGQHLAKLYEKEWDAFLRNPQKQVKKDSYNYLILTTNIWYTETASAVLDFVKFPAFFSSLHGFIHQSLKPAAKKYVKGKAKQPVKKGSTFEVTAQLAAIIRNVSEFDLKKRWQVPGVRFPYTEWFVAIDDPTLPIIFEKSSNRVVQSKKKFVQEKKTTALHEAIRKKYAGQQIAQELADLAEQRRKELEAIRVKEAKAKEKELYAGIMKLQQVQTDKTSQPPTAAPTPQKPPVQKPPVQKPQAQKPQQQESEAFIPESYKPQAQKPQPTAVSGKLKNALSELQNALGQLENKLYYQPKPTYQQPTYQQPAYQPQYQPQQEPEYEQEYEEEEPQEGEYYEGDYYYEDDYEQDGDNYGQGDYYYYDDDGSDSEYEYYYY